MEQLGFSDVYRQYHRLVLKVAKNILQDYILAQDVCQEVFVTLYEKYEYIDEDYLKFWLLANTKRKAIDYCKKPYQKYEVVNGDVDFGKRKKEPDENGIVMRIIRREFTNEILETLKDYNFVWYTIIVKVVIEKEDAKKMAWELGISIENLRIKLHRARTWIRKFYQDEYRAL